MGNIRKQTIISSVLVYIGFLIGAFNQYLYSKNGSFTIEEFGLTRVFFDYAQNMSALGALGVIPVIYKFYPFYKDNLDDRKIDLMTWSMIAALIGFVLVVICGIFFRPFFIDHFYEKSRLIITYYYWMFPFALGMLMFNVLESFSWALELSVLSNFLKETALRIVTTVLIVLFYTKVISYSIFIYLFSFQFLLIFLVLLIYLYRSGKLNFTLRVSRVTRKFWKKIVAMQAMVFGGSLIASLAATIDTFFIAGFQGLQAVGIFIWAQYAANLIQVPQRSIQAVSASVLSRAWKEKNLPEIQRIYSRSSINLLLMALFIFGNLWLNVKDAIHVFNIQDTYLQSLGVIFILGMVRIIDAGTGLNAMVINTSTYWRFDFISGVVLLFLRLPLTYFLIKKYGIIGSAFAELAAYATYNFIRFEFLRRKFNMQPFTMKTLYSILLAVGAYCICDVGLSSLTGWTAIITKGTLFSTLLIGGIFLFKLTPDACQLYHVALKRFNKNK